MPHRVLAGALPPGDRLHEVALVHRLQRHLADRRVVERRKQEVEAEEAHQSLRLHHLHPQRPVLRERGHQVHQRLLDVIHLAVAQGGDLGCRVGTGDPFDPVEIRDPRPGGEARGAGAGLVCLEPGVVVVRAGHPLVRKVAERPAADHFGKARGGRRLGEALRHDGADGVGGVRQRVRQEVERPLEAERDGLVVRRGDVVGGGGKCLPEGVADPPAPDARHAVARQHGGAVMEPQAGAQRERPTKPIRGSAGRLEHLRLHRPAFVHPEQRVEHHQHMVAGDEG